PRARLTAGPLAGRRMQSEMGADFLPRHAAIPRAVQVLRAVVNHARIVRGKLHRRNALETVNQIAAGVAVQRLRADPIALLVCRVQIQTAELALAASINDVGVYGVRDDRARFASGPNTEIL